MHDVLFNRLGGLSLPRKSVVKLTDRPDMTLDVYRGRETTMQQQQQFYSVGNHALPVVRRVEQQLEHALYVLYRKSCFACHYEGETIAGKRSLCTWKPLFACWYEG